MGQSRRDGRKMHRIRVCASALHPQIAARVLSVDERKRLYRSWRNKLHPDRHIEDREVRARRRILPSVGGASLFRFAGMAQTMNILPFHCLKQYQAAVKKVRLFVFITP